MNGQAKIDFLEWIKEEYPLLGVNDIIPNTCINALKIDFFDSVGIVIEVFRVWDLKHWIYVIDNVESEKFKTRQEATEKAIEKAVEIYNNLKK